MSSERVTNLYDVMDSAYDVPQIHDMSRQLGHKSAEVVRYNERRTVERVNARLKDEFGGRVVRVRGYR